MSYTDFNDFLFERFDKADAYNSFLSKDSPELFDEWVAEQDVDDLIKWANEYANIKIAEAVSLVMTTKERE